MSSWSCDQCTYINTNASAQICGTCQSQRRSVETKTVTTGTTKSDPRDGVTGLSAADVAAELSRILSNWPLELIPIVIEYWLTAAIYCMTRFDTESSTIWMLSSPMKDGSVWVPIAKISPRRQAPLSCLWRNQFYVLGGLMTTSEGYSKSMVTIVPPSRAVGHDTYVVDNHSLPPMTLGRYVAASCVLNNRWYVLGGRHTTANVDTNQAEVYDFILSQWTVMKPMEFARSSAAIATYNDRIYVFGGTTDSPSAEMYDPKTDTWTRLKDMPTTRVFSQAKAIPGVGIAIIGGRESSSTNLSTSIYYDVAANAYFPLPWSLPCGGADRGAVACCDDGTLVIVDPQSHPTQAACWALDAAAATSVAPVAVSQWRAIAPIPVTSGLIACFAPA